MWTGPETPRSVTTRARFAATPLTSRVQQAARREEATVVLADLLALVLLAGPDG